MSDPKIDQESGAVPLESSSRQSVDPAFATTLAHGLGILEAFHNSTGALSNSEIAQRTGLSRPTVSRLAYTLEELGYLRRDETGRYLPGVGILAIAYPLLAGLKVRQLARPLMRDYATYAGGTVSIATTYGLDFIYLQTLRMTDIAPHIPEIGFRSSLALTAVGRALLSLYTDDELKSYVTAMETERPDEWRRTADATLAAIESCRARGFSVSLGEWKPEIYGVAAPLYRTENGQCLAVNCGIPSFRFSPDQVERDCGPRMLGLARNVRSLVDHL
ncbi:IclR family transcriptional regulator [Nitrobacteraceae bacterium UC4446_H13]